MSNVDPRRRLTSYRNSRKSFRVSRPISQGVTGLPAAACRVAEASLQDKAVVHRTTFSMGEKPHSISNVGNSKGRDSKQSAHSLPTDTEADMQENEKEETAKVIEERESVAFEAEDSETHRRLSASSIAAKAAEAAVQAATAAEEAADATLERSMEDINVGREGEEFEDVEGDDAVELENKGVVEKDKEHGAGEKDEEGKEGEQNEGVKEERGEEKEGKCAKRTEGDKAKDKEGVREKKGYEQVQAKEGEEREEAEAERRDRVTLAKAAELAAASTLDKDPEKEGAGRQQKAKWRRRTTLDMLEGIGFESDTEESMSSRCDRSRRSSSRGPAADDSDISYGVSSEEEDG